LSDYEKKNYSNGIKKNIDSLTYYARKMQKSKDPCTAVYGKFIEANNYYKIGNYKKSEQLCLLILHELKNSTNNCQNKNKYRVFERLFWINKNTNRYKEAFDYLVLKESISKTFKKDTKYHLKELANQYSKALIKTSLSFHDQAIIILKDALDKANNIVLKTDKERYYFTTHKSSALNILGDVYLTKSLHKNDSNLDSASVYYRKAFEVAQNFSPPHKDTYWLFSLRNIKVHIEKEEYKAALSLLKSIDNNLTVTNLNQDINFLKSIVYYNLERRKLSINFAYKFLNPQKNRPNTKENLIKIYDLLAKQYNLLKQKDSAYKYSKLGLKEVSELNDHKTEINKSHYLYNFNQIKKENESVIKTEQKTHVTQIIFISVVAVLFILYLIYIAKIKRRKAIEEFDVLLDEIQTTETPPKKDYNIEKELEENILLQLKELENSTEFLSCDFNIKALATKLETNTSYLSYIINNTKNQSFKQYITKLRIDYLINKLNTEEQYQNYTIQYLAEEIGYTNASAFTRAFKKELGITPSEHIKSLKK
jgi:AraC-like DNA-binding protein